MGDADPGESSSPVAEHSEPLDVAGLSSYDLASLAAKLPTGRDAASKKVRKVLLDRSNEDLGMKPLRRRVGGARPKDAAGAPPARAAAEDAAAKPKDTGGGGGGGGTTLPPV